MIENYWQRKSDQEVLAASSQLADFREEVQEQILTEMNRRSLKEAPLPIQEKEPPKGHKSRIPNWVRYVACIGLLIVLKFALQVPGAIAALISIALVEPLAELANYGPLRERARLALGAELAILDLALAIWVYPHYFARFIPDYCVIGASAFLCLAALYFIQLLYSEKRHGFVKWISVSAGVSVLLGLAGQFIPTVSQYWHSVSERWQW